MIENESIIVSSRKRIGPPTPFKDISNGQDLERAKELKNQRNREYYARNRDNILARRREANENKQASAAVINGADISSSYAISS